VLGLSDAGAHASQLCDACFSTHLLQYWVRERQALDLEFAVWRLTGHAADVFRIPRRGRIAVGNYADVVVFDPETIGAGAATLVADLPGGSARLTSDANGVQHVFVNGVETVTDNESTGAVPGTIIRAGRDTATVSTR
jgi:N-acyl-D-aspartate/D-glutamate deacylase